MCDDALRSAPRAGTRRYLVMSHRIDRTVNLMSHRGPVAAKGGAERVRLVTQLEVARTAVLELRTENPKVGLPCSRFRRGRLRGWNG